MDKDIKNRQDIELLVNTFYDKIKTDQIIGYFFIDVVPVNWEKHLPIMYDFWENIVFFTGGYEGNPMQKHQCIHDKSPMKAEHFDHWIKLFKKSVDELFVGEHAEVIKQRATSIATVMKIKIVY